MVTINLWKGLTFAYETQRKALRTWSPLFYWILEEVEGVEGIGGMEEAEAELLHAGVEC